jgi:hypothetical protein
MASDIDRPSVLKGAAGTPGPRSSRSEGAESLVKPAPTVPPPNRPAMQHIGAPESRLDGMAKVTGAAKYAAEYKPEGLVYGSVVT